MLRILLATTGPMAVGSVRLEGGVRGYETGVGLWACGSWEAVFPPKFLTAAYTVPMVNSRTATSGEVKATPVNTKPAVSMPRQPAKPPQLNVRGC